MEDADEEKVGILAAAFEFPGVGVENGTDTLWETLCPPKPKFLYTRVPPSRWTNIARFEQAGRQTDAELLDEVAEEHNEIMKGQLPGGQPVAGLLKKPEKLDPSFFGLNEGEVGWLDPHHRVLLHLTAHALHRANFLDKNWQDLQGRKVGVFMGVSNDEWAEVCPEPPSHASERGAAGSRASDLISQCFGLTGPSITVNSACASTMSALETAVQNLLLNKCDVAIVGAAHLLLSPKTHEMRELAGLLIKGCSHKLSEGCGVLVLQKVGRARAEGRHIMAVVRGVGTTFVGTQAEEKVARQEELAKQVMEEAGCDADGKKGRVAYVEMSGTGSPDEDEEEGLLLARLYQPQPSSFVMNGEAKMDSAAAAGPSVLLGCAKPLFGHMDAASGMLGLCKALVILEHRMAPPQSSGLAQLKESLADTEDGEKERVHACIPAELTPLGGGEEEDGGKEPLMVAVHSVAWTGVAGHVILSEYAGQQPPRPKPQPVKTEASSDKAAQAKDGSSSARGDDMGKGASRGPGRPRIFTYKCGRLALKYGASAREEGQVQARPSEVIEVEDSSDEDVPEELVEANGGPAEKSDDGESADTIKDEMPRRVSTDVGVNTEEEDPAVSRRSFSCTERVSTDSSVGTEEEDPVALRSFSCTEQVSTDIGVNTEEEDPVASRRSFSCTEPLVFDNLRSYQWWLGDWQLPIEQEDEEETESEEEEEEKHVGGKRKGKGKQDGSRKKSREEEEAKAREEAAQRRAELLAQKREEQEREEREAIMLLIQQAQQKRGRVLESVDMPEWLDALKRKDEAAVKRWLSCAYQVQGDSLLVLVKWNKPQLVLMALEHMTADGRQTLVREETSAPRLSLELRRILTDKNLKAAYPLHYATVLNSPEVVRALYAKTLEQQTNESGVSLVTYLFKDHEGLTPLHYAFRYGKKEALEALLELGHDQTHWDKMGNPPLLWLKPEDAGLLDVVEKYKVDLNVEDRDFKQTLLSWAMLYQNPEELYGDRTPEEQQRQAEAWRRFSSTLRSKGAVFGRHMLRHCQKDLSRAIEAKPVPVIPPAIEEGAQNGPSSPAASGGGKKKHAKAEVAEAPTEALPYPLFAYSADSLYNPVITPHTCCQCPGNCRTNPECACRNRYPGQVPLQPGTERLSDNQLGSTLFECGEDCRCVKEGRTDCGLFLTKNEGLGVNVEVRYTKEKGWGVHAKEDILKGTYVATYIGEYITLNQMEQRRKDPKAFGFKEYDSHYVVEMQVQGGFACVDAGHLGNVARLFNNSCDPSLKMYKVATCHQYPKVGFFALRDIAIGEELTFKYSSERQKGPKARKGQAEDGTAICLCGADNCRGFI